MKIVKKKSQVEALDPNDGDITMLEQYKRYNPMPPQAVGNPAQGTPLSQMLLSSMMEALVLRIQQAALIRSRLKQTLMHH